MNNNSLTQFTSLVFLSITFILITYSCSPRNLSNTYNDEIYKKQYERAVNDASIVKKKEISKGLIEVSKSNTNIIHRNTEESEYIMVVTWIPENFKDSYTKPDTIENWWGDVWVTIVPELKTICQSDKFGRKESVNLRLEQLLGLPPNNKKEYFVELWVDPKDLFRPCPDMDINDSECQLSFPENYSKDHFNWINEKLESSYENENWKDNYPFSNLGYSYDWNRKNRNNVGLSEFLIKKDSKLFLNKVFHTSEYCNVEIH